MIKFFYCLLPALLLPNVLLAQRIDNMASHRDFETDNYFRFHYDNDYFTASDIYYTQGYNFEYVAPALRKNPINALFLKYTSSQKFGISLEHMGFTPTTIKSDAVLRNDRPFAAAIMLKSFVITTDTVSKSRLSSALSVGIIGPGAFGYDMQKTIHEWVDDDIPLGWQHQIKNDLLLNYEVAHEKELYRFRNLVALNTNAKLRLGTVNTNISAGLTTTFGYMESPFSASTQRKFKFYGYFQSVATGVGYDATLQGGLFNRKSPHTIASDDISRLTLQHNFGLVLQYKSVYLEYSRSELTKEFRSGNAHRWGGIRIGAKL